MSGALEIWCVTPSSSGGWGPITSMASLAGQLLDARVRFTHPDREYGRLRRAASLLPGRRHGDRALLLIAAAPGDLLTLVDPAVLAGRFGRVGAWVIDSFWAERTPRFARGRRHGIDHLWVTDAELVDGYQRSTGTSCEWLPWGTDALGAVRTTHPAKEVDVLRLGRQPATWDDDETNRATLSSHGLSYQGRLPLADDGPQNQSAVQRQLARAKVVLASGSLASPSDYSHPTRDYISARFTDAVAAGTRIAGVRPRCAAAELIPDEAWVDLEATDRESDARVLAAAVTEHSEQRADRLRAAALESLDWRHRFAVIAERLELESGTLDHELTELRGFGAAAGRGRE